MIDALILLGITRTRVDGVIYDRSLCERFGGANPIALDSLRREVSVEILAHSLRLPLALVKRRVRLLAEQGQCSATPTGMLSAEWRSEATGRSKVEHEVYKILQRAMVALRVIAFFDDESLPPVEPKSSVERVGFASAHGAKYVLRLLGAVAECVGDYVDAAILIELLRSGERERAPAAAVGLPAGAVARRLGRLVSDRVCTRSARGHIVCAPNAPWVLACDIRNQDALFQLIAGLAEVGALRPGQGASG